MGLTVFGFGLSAAIVGPLADYLAANLGVQAMLRVIGLLFLVIMIISAISLRFPPSGWSPSGWSPQDKRRLLARI